MIHRQEPLEKAQPSLSWRLLRFCSCENRMITHVTGEWFVNKSSHVDSVKKSLLVPGGRVLHCANHGDAFLTKSHAVKQPRCRNVAHMLNYFCIYITTFSWINLYSDLNETSILIQYLLLPKQNSKLHNEYLLNQS